MDIASVAINIAVYLKTAYQGKKHGGYDIYEDDKVRIIYDTYYPNVDVYVKTPDGAKHLVLCRSGHGYNQEYHPGDWEMYLQRTLLPLSVDARIKKEQKVKDEEARRNEEKYGAAGHELNKVFA